MNSEILDTQKSLALDTDKTALVNRAAKSVKWSILYNTVPRLITPLSTIMLAALLTPDDFGLVAISTLVIALARIVVDLGLGKTIVQCQSRVQESASISLWISLFVAIAIYFVLWILSPWLSTIYADSRVINVVRVSSLSLIFAAVSIVPKSLLIRKMDFQLLFWVNSSFLIVQAITSVVLALLGFRYWSIIWGHQLGSFISMVLVWIFVRWLPDLLIDWSIFISLVRFSVWITISSFQKWLLLYADNAIAGLFLGIRQLGSYSLGFNIATIIPTFLITSLADVAYPAFCKLQNDRLEVGKSLLSLQVLTGAVLFPIVFGIAALASPTVRLLYGDKWENLGLVIAFLAVLPGLVPLWMLGDNAYQAIGRPDISTKLSVYSLLILLPLLWIAAPYGLIVFVIMRSIGSIFLPVFHVIASKRSLGIEIMKQLKGLFPPFLCSVLMFVIVMLFVQEVSPFYGFLGWIKLLSAAILGIVIYGLLMFLFSRELGRKIIVSAQQVFTRKFA
jgi:teichuronic acid exporter